MKKIFAIMLVLVMMFAVAVPTFAVKQITEDTDPADLDAHQSLLYTDTTNMPTDYQYYCVTIPAEVPILWGEEKTMTNYSIKTQLNVGERLKVTIDAGEQKLTNADTTATLPFSFSKTDGGPEIDLVNLAYTTDKEVDNINRPFNIFIAKADWAKVPVARYEANLTFTVEVIPA